MAIHGMLRTAIDRPLAAWISSAITRWDTSTGPTPTSPAPPFHEGESIATSTSILANTAAEEPFEPTESSNLTSVFIRD